jgi:adenylate kinase family enzyme
MQNMNRPFPYQRIAIIGTAGAGKTTLAQILAERFGAPFIELDALYWEPNWTPPDIMEFRERVEIATDIPAWVAAGNYHTSRDIVWGRAEAIIWLDYGLWLSLGRLLRRTWRRIFTHEELWNGNRENIWNQLTVWSTDSLIHWFFKTYWRRKREIPILLEWPEYKHLAVVHLRSQSQTDQWLARLG